MYERGLEHQGDARSSQVGLSHIRDHWEMAHKGVGEVDKSFTMAPIRFHKSALERLVQEAVLINKYGKNLLNLKEEYCRNEIPQLQVEPRFPRRAQGETKRRSRRGDKDGGNKGTDAGGEEAKDQDDQDEEEHLKNMMSRKRDSKIRRRMDGEMEEERRDKEGEPAQPSQDRTTHPQALKVHPHPEQGHQEPPAKRRRPLTIREMVARMTKPPPMAPQATNPPPTTRPPPMAPLSPYRGVGGPQTQAGGGDEKGMERDDQKKREGDDTDEGQTESPPDYDDEDEGQTERQSVGDDREERTEGGQLERLPVWNNDEDGGQTERRSASDDNDEMTSALTGSQSDDKCDDDVQTERQPVCNIVDKIGTVCQTVNQTVVAVVVARNGKLSRKSPSEFDRITPIRSANKKLSGNTDKLRHVSKVTTPGRGINKLSKRKKIMMDPKQSKLNFTHLPKKPEEFSPNLNMGRKSMDGEK